MAVTNSRAGTCGASEEMAPGIMVVEKADDPRIRSRMTLEGRIGLLLLAKEFQCYFIELPAGAYIPEHPHPKGSVVYTLRGRWVLCSQGKRRVMGPGSLFASEDNTPTGYEVPFGERALILVFKGVRGYKDEEDFFNYLDRLDSKLMEMKAGGAVFRLNDLPSDHPAVLFAKSVDWH